MFASNGRKMLFHLVDLKVEEDLEIHNLIVDNGGRVVKYHECDVMVLANRYHHKIDRVFHINFVRDSVNKGGLLDMIPYMLGPEKHMCLISLYLYGKSSCSVSSRDASIQTCRSLTDDNLSEINVVSPSKLTIRSDDEVPSIEHQSQEFSSTFHEDASDSMSPNLMRSALEIEQSASQLKQNFSRSPMQTDLDETFFRSINESLSEQMKRKADSPVSEAETIVIRKSQKTTQKQYPDSDESFSSPEKNRALFDMPSPLRMQPRSHATKNFTSNDLLDDTAIIDDSDVSDGPAPSINPLKRVSTEQKSSSSNVETKSYYLGNAAGRQNSKPVTDESATIDSDDEIEVNAPVTVRRTKPATISSWISRKNSTQKNIKVTEINNTAPPRQLQREIKNDKNECSLSKTKSRPSKRLKTALIRQESTDMEDLSDSASDTEKPSTSKRSGVSKKSQKSAVVKAKAAGTKKSLKKKNNSARKRNLLMSSSDETDFETNQEQCGAAEETGTEVAKAKDVPETKESAHPSHPPLTRNYAPWEQKQMIKYLIETRQIHLAKGYQVWGKMVGTGKLRHRSVGSLNNNFRRSILPNIKMFITEGKDRDRFLSLL